MKSIGSGTFSEFMVHWKHIFNHARLLLFFYLIFTLLNPVTTGDIIREPKLEVVVDSVHKEISPKEDVIFYWTVYNNESFITIEVTAQCEPKTEFSESSFSLGPGERREVTQTIFISEVSENSTNISHEVHWNGMVQTGSTSGTFTAWSGLINVSFVNKTNFDEDLYNYEFNWEYHNSENSSSIFTIICLITTIFVALIIARKKLKKSRT
jgi:hypothetical protein